MSVHPDLASTGSAPYGADFPGFTPPAAAGASQSNAAATSGVSARYVKVVCHNSGGLTGIAELAVYGGKSRRNKLATTVTASTSYSGLSVGNINDGNAGTAWASNSEDPSTLTVDLGAVKTVAGLAITARNDNASVAGQAPSTIDVSYSTDGVSYTALDTFYASPWGTGTSQLFEF